MKLKNYIIHHSDCIWMKNMYKIFPSLVAFEVGSSVTISNEQREISYLNFIWIVEPQVFEPHGQTTSGWMKNSVDTFLNINRSRFKILTKFLYLIWGISVHSVGWRLDSSIWSVDNDIAASVVFDTVASSGVWLVSSGVNIQSEIINRMIKMNTAAAAAEWWLMHIFYGMSFAGS